MKRARRKDGAMLLGAGAVVLLLTVSAIAFLPCVPCPSAGHLIRRWHGNFGTGMILCGTCRRDTGVYPARCSLKAKLIYWLRARDS